MIKFKLSVCDGSFLTICRGLFVLVPMLPAADTEEAMEDACLAVAETGLEWTKVHRWP